MKRECPECSRFLPANASSCPSCGYQIEVRRESVAVSDFRCEWRSGGEQCHYAGSISENTKGGGPWYCSGHYFAMQRENAQDEGAKIVAKSREDVPSPHYGYDTRRLMAMKAMAMRQRLWEELHGKRPTPADA